MPTNTPAARDNPRSAYCQCVVTEPGFYSNARTLANPSRPKVCLTSQAAQGALGPRVPPQTDKHIYRTRSGS